MGGFGIVILVVIVAAVFMRTVAKDKPELKQWAVFVQAVAGIIELICLIPAIIVGCQQGEQKSLQQRLDAAQQSAFK